jgi:dTDP-4-dehydrorhamnose 3,5-epimerase
MRIIETNINGIKIIESSAFQDNRGAFSRLFCSAELEAVVEERQVTQINHSLTRAVGAVRGMHYQKPPYAEMKIVRCLKGRVLDVAIDLRNGSPTFLKWTAIELTPANRLSFVIPEGCAHGFQVLEADTELLYLHTAPYTPGAEGAISFDDPSVGIVWPLLPTDISVRDQAHPQIKEDFEGIII